MAVARQRWVHIVCAATRSSITVGICRGYGVMDLVHGYPLSCHVCYVNVGKWFYMEQIITSCRVGAFMAAAGWHQSLSVCVHGGWLVIWVMMIMNTSIKWFMSLWLCALSLMLLIVCPRSGSYCTEGNFQASRTSWFYNHPQKFSSQKFRLTTPIMQSV